MHSIYILTCIVRVRPFLMFLCSFTAMLCPLPIHELIVFYFFISRALSVQVSDSIYVVSFIFDRTWSQIPLASARCVKILLSPVVKNTHTYRLFLNGATDLSVLSRDLSVLSRDLSVLSRDLNVRSRDLNVRSRDLSLLS